MNLITVVLYVFAVCLCYYGTTLNSAAAAVCTTSRGQPCCDGYFKREGTSGCFQCRDGTFGQNCSMTCTCKVSEICHHMTGNCTPRQPGKSSSSLLPKDTESNTNETDPRTNPTVGGMKNQSLRSEATSAKIPSFLENISSTPFLLILIYKLL